MKRIVATSAVALVAALLFLPAISTSTASAQNYVMRRVRQPKRRRASRIRSPARLPRPEANSLTYQASVLTLNCVGVQPHFPSQSVIQPPFLRRI